MSNKGLGLPPGEDGSVGAAGDAAKAPADAKTDWLTIAQTTYRASTDYLDANLRRQWEHNIHLFQGRHPPGSKYLEAGNQNRSRLFRPKTRSAVRRSEAACAQAFFSNLDVLSVTPNDDSDPFQLASAKILQELLQYRLTKTIPWFLIVMGAWQTTRVLGICASRQIWRYKEKVEGKELRPIIDPVTGQPRIDPETNLPEFEEVDKVKVIEDRPEITLIPPENLRFDPGADWTDIVKSSPYLIVKHPMYVVDVEEMMRSEDPKTGQPRWKKYEREKIAMAREGSSDSTALARQGGRQDTRTEPRPITDFDIVWPREYFVRLNGHDWVFWTLGDHFLLTDPVPIEEVYPTGVRPYVIGFSTIEAFKAVPQSMVELTSQIQAAINEVQNSRFDNVKHAINARYFAKRGGDIDLDSLRRNVAGSITLMKDPTADVVVHRAPDVTRSAYEEQDRLNVDFDELAGIFAASSVQTNRRLNETVGGMQLLSADANAVGDYDLRVFAKTWAEPVLRQLVLLERKHETDPIILTVAGNHAQLWERYGINYITDELFDQEVFVNVNVGIGATNPVEKLNRFLTGARAIAELFGPLIQRRGNFGEFCKEVFGAMGYENGERFFDFGDDPVVAQLEAIIEDLEQQLQDTLGPEKIRAESKMQEIAANLRADTMRMLQEMKLEREKMAADFQIKMQQTLLQHALREREAAVDVVTRQQSEAVAGGDLTAAIRELVQAMRENVEATRTILMQARTNPPPGGAVA